MRILVTGGCGFIGSNFIKYLLERENDFLEIFNFDKLTYAGRGKNLEHMNLSTNSRYNFICGDVANPNDVTGAFEQSKPDLIVNFAAESHVDNSIAGPDLCKRTNIHGTEVMLDISRLYNTPRFLHVSTDEVYGSIAEGSHVETDKLTPTKGNPYACSKAEAEGVVRKAIEGGLDVVITRSANNYGRYQHPEKFVPRAITNLIDGKPIPLMYDEQNPGLNTRDWLDVEDNCGAIWFLAMNGKSGEAYNIPGNNEWTNIEVARTLASHFGFGEEMIAHIPHRKSHDARYSISGEKLKALGFGHKHTRDDFEKRLGEICEWYKENENWWRRLVKS